MTRNCRRFLCFVLAALMLASLLPASVAGNSALADETTYGKTIKENVNFRVGPSMKDKLMFRVKINTICKVLGQVTANGYSWYKVEARDPEKKNPPIQTGYLRGDCFRLLTDAEAAAFTGSTDATTPRPVVTATVNANTPSPSETNTDSDAPSGTIGYITAGGVNFRAAPGGTVIQQLNRGTAVNVLSIPTVISTDTWYKVEYEGKTGYIMSTFLSLNGDPVVTSVPTAEPQPSNPEALGWVMTIKGSVNIRASIGGTSLRTVGKYVTMPYLLTPVRRGNYTWYFVQVNASMKGYVRGDCVKIVSDPGDGGGSSPVITATPGAVVTPTPTPQPGTPTGYLKTSMSYVNIRKSKKSGAPGGDVITVAKNKGTVFPYYGAPTVSNNIKWYYIYSPDFGFAWIHGNYIVLTDEGGAVVTPTPTPVPVVTPTPTPEPGTTPVPSSSGTTEASYTTLKSGSSGLAVQNLVAELINQGYYKYSLTSKYTSSVENAVRAFQKAKGLEVDGIAGPKTQHALFNTVEPGTADHTNLSMTLYPAEKIDWNTGGIQELWPRGANVKVYDVYTGKVWWAHRWAGGSHIDAEPLTAADTKTLCEIYGVKKASEITSKTHWQRRPLLITIGTRTFAASLYGVPHNPDGNTIKDNNFDGQLCIHFTNSKTHESSKVDTEHQKAIEYAWLNAPNGHK